MSYQLSLLDKSPIPDGATAADALAATVAMAQRAEQLGFHRYWLAEHHNSKALAGAAPEVAIAYILAKTSRIRVGSGGVMLQHYSPYKVAEVFKVLASLAPGRVDLGIGKAPGGLPRSTEALQAVHDKAVKPGFADLLTDLNGFLTGALPADHQLNGAIATPIPPELPQRILLGASPESAELAARLGWQFTYAGHFNSDPATIERSFEVYRSATGRAPLFALYAFAAETAEKADAHWSALKIYRLYLPDGRRVNVGSLDMAAEFARQAGVTEYRTEETRPQVIAGTPEHVRRELDRLSQRFGIAEFVIDTPVPHFAERLRSIELLAGQRQSIAA